MTDTTELRVARKKLIDEARAILDKAEAEKRSMAAEDRQHYDKLWAAQGTALTEIEDIERRNSLEAEDEHTRLEAEEAERRKAADKKGDEETTSQHFTATPEYRTAFHKYLTGSPPFSAEEQRALSAGTATEGGYLYADEQFVNQLIQNVTDATVIRSLATIQQVRGADTLGIPVLTNRMAAAAWTSELGAPSTDSTLALGKRALTPHPLAKEIRVSKTLLRKAPNSVGIVNSELARVSAEAQENAFMTGTGAQQPLGIFTASADGITTGRDVSDGNTTTLVKFDGLKEAQYTLKQAYWAATRWVFHRNVFKKIAKEKDGNGQYMLQPSVTAREGDSLLGFPVILSEYAPSTMTTGKYVGAFADFSDYWIAEDLNIEIVRATEIYIRENQDLFVMRASIDGAPVREEAFVRVKLA